MIFTPNPKRQQRQLQISERKVLIALGDVAAVWLAVLIALRLWTLVAGYAFTPRFVAQQGLWFLVLAGLWLFLASANDFYDLRVAANWSRSLQRLLVITAQMVVVYVLVFFVSPRDALPRLFILYYGVASFILIGLWRFARPALLGWASQPRRMLIVGTSWASEVMVAAIREFAAHEYEVRGIIGRPEEVGQVMGGVPVLGAGADVMNFVYRDQITEIVITGTHEMSGETFQAVMDAYERGVVIIPMTLLYERITGRVPVEHVNNDWAVVFLPMKNTNDIFDPYPVLKRLMDIGFALVGLALFLLLFPLIVLAIRLNSRGSIFYSQERLGRNGSVFRLYKLRSMVQDAEAKTGAVFSQRGDPRVTKVGRFLRKTRLDEVPQLINVLRGDMSLIGPRPERPEHVQRLTQKIPFYRTRLIVRPGLTGWAQVRYDYGSTDEDALVKLQYDLYYIRHHSLLLDANILVRTVGKVLTMSGI
jgi:exopolysaccharide biosynthesis polyprenyl glycosylphosphotransferase